MDKIAKYNIGVKYLLIAVDVLSCFVRVEPMKTKTATYNSCFEENDNKNISSEGKVRQRTRLRKSLNSFLIPKMSSSAIHTVKQSAFAERNVRPLKNNL